MIWFTCEVCGLEHPRELAQKSCPLKDLVRKTGKIGLDALPSNFHDAVLLHSLFHSRVPNEPA